MPYFYINYRNVENDVYSYKNKHSQHVVHEVVSSFGVDAGALVTDIRLTNDDVAEVALKPRPSPAWRERTQRPDYKQKANKINLINKRRIIHYPTDYDVDLRR